MTKRIFAILFSLFLLLPCPAVFAQEESTTTLPGELIEAPELEVSPRIIDATTKARDILEYTITLINKSDHFIHLYPLVNDLTAEGKIAFNDPTDLEKSISLARWIRVKRGEIEIKPGAQYELPLSVEVALNAKPGTYHAAVTFSPASNVVQAEQNASEKNLPTLLINATVADETVEKAEGIIFKTEKNIYLDTPVKFILSIKNIGNVPITPRGSIIVYDRKGREVDSFKLNEDKQSISQNNDQSFTYDWKPPAGKSLGKFRAKANIEYGEKTARDLSDSIYFWILPLFYILSFGGIVVLMIVILTLFLFRRTYVRHHPAERESDGVINLRSHK